VQETLWKYNTMTLEELIEALEIQHWLLGGVDATLTG
jgi:hypothetical protein